MRRASFTGCVLCAVQWITDMNISTSNTVLSAKGLVMRFGGITATNFRDMQAKHPGRALEKAVKGMLPKGPLGYAMIKKLKVYGGAEHPHSAQQPKVLEIAALSNGVAK